VTACELDEDLVVYEPRTGQAFVLNASAAQIWALCDGDRSVAGIAEAMASRYQLDRRQALADVRACVEDLVRAGVLAR
jgi:PqqD family protein of HPr-rel-A system